MRDWTAEELDKIGAADELEIAALGPDGTLRPFTTIWGYVEPMVRPDATAATVRPIAG